MFEDGEDEEICHLHDLNLDLEIDLLWVDHLEMIDSEMITLEEMDSDEKQVLEMTIEEEMILEVEMMILEATEIEMTTMMIEDLETNQCHK